MVTFAVFQKKLDSIYIRLNGVISIVDCMIIFGKMSDSKDSNLILFLETVEKNGLKFNKD